MKNEGICTCVFSLSMRGVFLTLRYCGLFISGALLVYWVRVVLSIVYFLVPCSFLLRLQPTNLIRAGGIWIEEAIEVETRMFECGRRTEETGVVAEMTPILATLPLYPISHLLCLSGCF